MSAVSPELSALDFRRGYIGASTVDHPAGTSWPATTLGPLTFHRHPELRQATARDDRTAVLLLGEIVDVADRDADPTRIARRVCQETSTTGLMSAIRYVAYLGGRFACFVFAADRFVALPDCQATLPIYWLGRSLSDITVASHVNLVAEAAHPEVDDEAVQFVQKAKEMGTPGTLYYPGVRTPYHGVRPVLPNHCLDVGADEITHRRFYPFVDTKRIRSSRRAQKRFVTAFSRHTRELCALGRSAVALTAGMDSGTTLAAALGHYHPDSFAFTYCDERRQEHLDDLSGALHRARLARMEHRLVPMPDTIADDAFERAYGRSFRFVRQYPRLAYALYAALPEDAYHLLSMASETGTGFYKRRDQSTFDARRLASMYSPHEFGRLPEVVEAYEEFIEYATFTAESLAPFDYHDMFYWENRMPRWAANRIQEADLAHRVLLPFNQRTIIESLLSLPFAARRDKQPLRHLMKRRRLE